MRIISKWKDYYDHVGHVYGGQQDNHTIYERKVIGEQREGYVLDVDVELPNTGESVRGVPRLNSLSNTSFRWLFVAGKSYLCVLEGYGKPITIINQKDHAPIIDEICSGYSFMQMRKKDVGDFVGVEDIWGVRISKQLNVPVFFYYAKYSNSEDVACFKVSGEVPVLADVGFAKILPATTCYQIIAHYVANTLSKQDVPSNMTDVEKIVSHGFDKKKSFRHRK